MPNLKQKINLYPICHTFTPVFSFGKILTCWIVVSLLMIGLVIEEKIKLNQTVERNQALVIKQQALDEKMAQVEISKKSKSRFENKSLSLKELTSESVKNQKLIEIYQQNKMNNQHLLSESIKAIVSNPIQGVTLSYLHAKSADNQFLFQGTAVQAALMPMLLQTWQKIPSLMDRQFTQVKVLQGEPQKTWIKFELLAQ